MKSGFLDTSTEEYGYYVVGYEINRVGYDNSGWAYLHGFFLGTTVLLGVPTEQEGFVLTAVLDIFDSNGNHVKRFFDVGTVEQTAGLYYGHNPTKNVEREFRRLFSNVLKSAKAQSDEINQALLQAGPITPERDSVARENIGQWHAAQSQQRSASSSGSSYTPTTSVPQTASPAPSTPTLETGKYTASGSRIAMNINMGMVTLYDGGTIVGSGSYRINGNQIVITILTASGVGSDLQGKTFAYTITSNSSFSGGGETWVKTGLF
jgi:hypothetical protein